MTHKEWFVEAYDRHVSESGNYGSAVEKSRDATAHAYADAVEAGEQERYAPDLVSEGRALFDQFVKPERDRRKSSMRRSMEYLLDALNDGTILGVDDPSLAMAFPLGDGRDKTLAHWTAEDWRAATTERFRNAAKVTEAASDFDEQAEKIVRFMQDRQAATVASLFTAELGGGAA